MPRKTTARTTGETLKHFRDLCEVSKTNIIQQLNQAIAQNVIEFKDELNAQRTLALISNILDVENAETYQKLQHFVK